MRVSVVQQLLLFWFLLAQCHGIENDCMVDETCTAANASSSSDPFGLDDGWCTDLLPECQEQALEQKCLLNQDYMSKNCRKACNVLCGDSMEEALEWLQVKEELPDLEPPNVREAVNDTVGYMRRVLVQPEFDNVKFRCKNVKKDCFWWQSLGNCENEHADWMEEHCAASCQACLEKDNDKLAGQVDFDDLTSPEFWRGVAKSASADLHVNQVQKNDKKLSPVTPDPERTLALREKMVYDGYIELSDWTEEDVKEDVQTRLEKLTIEFRKAIVEIGDKRRLLPQLMLVYDEVWEVVNALTSALEPLFGLTLAHDFYVFNVKPGASGTVLHRDRNGEDWKIQFQKEEPYEGLPVYTTVWFGLTNANQTTSSMYILPAHADYDYRKYSDDPNFYEQDAPNEEVLIANYRKIRPLPAKTGTAFAWSHRALHWSSAPPHDAPHPRQTLTFAMAKPETEAPMLKHSDKSVPPPFEARLVVIVYCAIAYHYNFYALEKDVLLQFLTILADPKYSQHLTDESLSPLSHRTLGAQFLSCVQEFWNDDDLRPVLEKPIERLAHYIINDRKLEGNYFLRWVVEGGDE